MENRSYDPGFPSQSSIRLSGKFASLWLVVRLIFSLLTFRKAFAFAPQTTGGSSKLLKGTLATISLSPISIPEDSSGLSYGERSRPYRRTVYTHQEWVKHRSTDRFVGNLSNIFKSGVIRQLSKQVGLVAASASFVCLFNAFLVAGFDDFAGSHHDALVEGVPLMQLPSLFVTLTSPALSLLLVFKTNTSYQRWDEGRKAWGVIVNCCRTILRQGAAWIQETDITLEEKRRLMARLAAAVWCVPRSLTCALLSPEEDEAAYREDCRAQLCPMLAKELIAARHRPTRALYELSSAISDFPIGDFRRTSMDATATVLCNAIGDCERIFTSPVPLVYTRHTARFLEVFLLLMPLSLYDAFHSFWNHCGMIPASVVISFFLFGIEELGIQKEEPFSVLPLHYLTYNIGLSAQEHIDWMIVDQQNTNHQHVDTQSSMKF